MQAHDDMFRIDDDLEAEIQRGDSHKLDFGTGYAKQNPSPFACWEGITSLMNDRERWTLALASGEEASGYDCRKCRQRDIHSGTLPCHRQMPIIPSPILLHPALRLLLVEHLCVYEIAVSHDDSPFCSSLRLRKSYKISERL
jgi:hypothetical protein